MQKSKTKSKYYELVTEDTLVEIKPHCKVSLLTKVAGFTPGFYTVKQLAAGLQENYRQHKFSVNSIPVVISTLVDLLEQQEEYDGDWGIEIYNKISVKS